MKTSSRGLSCNHFGYCKIPPFELREYVEVTLGLTSKKRGCLKNLTRDYLTTKSPRILGKHLGLTLKVRGFMYFLTIELLWIFLKLWTIDGLRSFFEDHIMKPHIIGSFIILLLYLRKSCFIRDQNIFFELWSILKKIKILHNDILSHGSMLTQKNHFYQYTPRSAVSLVTKKCFLKSITLYSVFQLIHALVMKLKNGSLNIRFQYVEKCISSDTLIRGMLLFTQKFPQ